MATDYIELDFGTDEPVQVTGGGAALVPDGVYALMIKRIEATATQAGAPMISTIFEIADGKYPGAAFAGKRIIDNFVLPDPSKPESSRFGQQRFHGLIIACGGQRMTGQQRLPLGAFVGKRVISELVEDSYVPTGKSEDRRIVRSKPVSYYLITDPEAVLMLTEQAPDLSTPVAASAAPASAPATPAAVTPVGATPPATLSPVAATPPAPAVPAPVAAASVAVAEPVAEPTVPAVPALFEEPAAATPPAAAAQPVPAPVAAQPAAAPDAPDMASELEGLFAQPTA